MKNLKEGVSRLRVLAEAEGEYAPHLEKIKHHLASAISELKTMLRKPHDGTVSPKEIKDMNVIESFVKLLQKFIDQGIEQ